MSWKRTPRWTLAKRRFRFAVPIFALTFLGSACEPSADVGVAGDPAGFETAADQLTTACNACHIAADRGAIVMQRPTHPPFTNLRFRP